MDGDQGALLVLESDAGGAVLIPTRTPLSRLNYFDGKFLKAADLELEQRYLRDLVALSNQGLGAGVVYGFDTTLEGGDRLKLGPGLAVDPAGNVLYLPQAAQLSIAAVIAASKATASKKRVDASGKTGADAFTDCVDVAAPPPVEALPEGNLWVIAICRAEAFCGQEDVFGKLCEEACITSTDRPFRTEGVVVRAIPLQLRSPFPTSRAVALDTSLYLRSLVAHAAFADEVLRHPRALSRPGLLSTTWCLGAGYDSSCCEVPLAVVGRSGSTTVFLDAWTVRRERMDAPSRRSWQWKMRMRPWDVFMAHVLQFQCHLAHLLAGQAPPAEPERDPCRPSTDVLAETATFLEKLRQKATDGRDAMGLLGLSFNQIGVMRQRIDAALKAAASQVTPTDRILVRGGMVELPSAGYLPVLTGTTRSVNDQVRALLGEGLDYRFCVVTADFPAHELEAAQHMDRISLLQGLDDPNRKPKVDVLVPEGRIVQETTTPDAAVYDAALRASTENTGGLFYKGAAREEALSGGGTALYAAGTGLSQAVVGKVAVMARAARGGAAEDIRSVLSSNVLSNPFTSRDRDPTTSPTFFSSVVNAASRARTGRFASRVGTLNMAVALSSAAEATRAAAAAEGDTVDGFWLDATTSRRLRDLPLHGQSEVHGRIIGAQLSDQAVSLEASFKGVLTVIEIVPGTQARPLTVRALLQPLVALEISYDQPARKTELELIQTIRLDLELQLTFEGTPAFGKVTVDVFNRGGPDRGQPDRPMFRVERATGTAAHSVQYTLFSTSADPADPTRTAFTALGMLELDQNVDVLRADNINHRLAEQGLDIVQGTRLQTEPDFRATAEPRLFPPLPAATTEMVIQPMLDWVMFHKRREKKCTAVFERPEVKPPRPYRVLEVTADTEADAREWVARLSDPAFFAAEVQRQAKLPPFLVVNFAGGNAIPLFSFEDVERDWEQFDPGKRIVHVFYGSIGDHDVGLQTSRLGQLEDAIDEVSQEEPGKSGRTPLVPFPPAARPADAEGVMFFVTAEAALTCEEVIDVPLPMDATGAPSFDLWNRMIGLIKTIDNNPGNLATIEGLLNEVGSSNLGKVNFVENTDQIPDSSGTEMVARLATGKRVHRMLLWQRSGDPQVGSRKPQAEAIRSLLGTRVNQDVQVEVGDTATPPKVVLGNTSTACPALVFLATFSLIR
jgi:hypothetical protein